MPANVETITCNFIGEFKNGDNMWRAANALTRLSASNDGTFNKLMVVQAGSVVEAALHQIFYRAEKHTKEGLPNISEADLKKIRESKADRFYDMIETMKDNKLLDGLGADIYKDLHQLRHYRNRVHIQVDDKPEGSSRDDYYAFNKTIVGWALELCLKVLKHLGQKYPRPQHLAHFAHQMTIPLS
jgi:hypothetical protein